MFQAIPYYGSNCESSCVTSCLPGWERVGDRCYFWSKEKKNWFEAEETCKSYHGHLASVTNQSIHDYMMSKNEQVWIGSTDLNGEWVWTDCSFWDFLSGWKWGEPSGRHSHNGVPEDCMEYLQTAEEWTGRYYKYSYLWNDNWCYRQQEFVCSQEICAVENKSKNNDSLLTFLTQTFDQHQRG